MKISVERNPFHKASWPPSTVEIEVVMHTDLEKWVNDRLGDGSAFMINLEERILDTIEPYVPRKDGDLIESAHKNRQGTEGSGVIVWGGGGLRKPYAAWQYFNNPGPPRPTGGLRGARWVERWGNDGLISQTVKEAAERFGFKFGG